MQFGIRSGRQGENVTRTRPRDSLRGISFFGGRTPIEFFLGLLENSLCCTASRSPVPESA